MSKKKILVHTILFLFTFGIGNIIYIYYTHKKKNNIVLTIDSHSELANDDDFLERELMYKKLDVLNQKYKAYVNKHYSLIEKIGFRYSVAINQKSIFNKETNICIDLCLEDINLAPELKKYFSEESIIRGEELNLPTYPSFKYLAMIYEKQQDYLNAIKICIKAIKLGFLRDGTTGGMQGRLAKLIKKYNQQNNSNIQYNYEKNVIYDDNTGEIIY